MCQYCQTPDDYDARHGHKCDVEDLKTCENCGIQGCNDCGVLTFDENSDLYFCEDCIEMEQKGNGIIETGD